MAATLYYGNQAFTLDAADVTAIRRAKRIEAQRRRLAALVAR
jgi:hypothetical protein